MTVACKSGRVLQRTARADWVEDHIQVALHTGERMRRAGPTARLVPPADQPPMKSASIPSGTTTVTAIHRCRIRRINPDENSTSFWLPSADATPMPWTPSRAGPPTDPCGASAGGSDRVYDSRLSMKSRVDSFHRFHQATLTTCRLTPGPLYTFDYTCMAFGCNHRIDVWRLRTTALSGNSTQLAPDRYTSHSQDRFKILGGSGQT